MARPSITGRRSASRASSAWATRVAAALGIDSVNRFRHADVAAGGEGAPFAPLYHRALAADLDQPVMVLNLGGVGNVTYIDGDVVIAFDTGPASRPAGRLRAEAARQALRRGWSCSRPPGWPTPRWWPAACGIPISIALPRSPSTATISTPGPPAVENLPDADGRGDAGGLHGRVGGRAAAPRAPPRRALAGYRRGPAERRLHAACCTRCSACRSSPVEAVGWNGDFIEAQCFGYLAVRSSAACRSSLPTHHRRARADAGRRVLAGGVTDPAPVLEVAGSAWRRAGARWSRTSPSRIAPGEMLGLVGEVRLRQERHGARHHAAAAEPAASGSRRARSVFEGVDLAAPRRAARCATCAATASA